MQLSNLFISAIVSYISICDANYKISKPQPTTVVPSYPTEAPSHPVQPPTTDNGDLYFVCKLNEVRAKKGLKPLAYVDSVKSITNDLVNQYATVGHQKSNLFGKFNDAKCSVSQYVEQYFSGFQSLDSVAESLSGNQDGFIYKNDYDLVSFSFNNGYASVVLASSDKCDARAVPQCKGSPQPEQPKYPTKEPEVTKPEQPKYPIEAPKPSKVADKPSYPTKPVEAPKPKPPTGGVSEQARISLCLTNKYRAKNGKGPMMMSPTLCKTSVAQSIAMDGRSRLGHDGSNGNQPWDRIKSAGFEWASVAENIANGQASVHKVQDSWIESTGHRENLLSDNKCFGYGQSKDSNPGIYYTQNMATPAKGNFDCYFDDYKC